MLIVKDEFTLTNISASNFLEEHFVLSLTKRNMKT